jgi:TolB-like protein/tetratricopeptide (TPR) repeat protein
MTFLTPARRRPRGRALALSLVGGFALFGRTVQGQSPRVQPPPPCDAGPAGAATPSVRSADILITGLVSSSDATDHLAAGLAAGVAQRLRLVRGVAVAPGAPRSSRGELSPADIVLLGTGSNARYVLTGDLRKGRGVMRANVRLTRVANGRVVWTHEYERTDDRLADIEREAATTLAGFLAPTIGREGVASLTRLPTRSAVAYEAVMRGDYLTRFGRPDSLVPALRAYEEATRADPRYAVAFARIAATYAQSLESGWERLRLRPQAVLDTGLAAAARAIALAPRGAEGWVARGRLMVLRPSVDWGAARDAFRRGAAASPRDARVRGDYGLALLRAGQFEQAQRELVRALLLDPGEPELLTALGEARVYQRQYRSACAALNGAVRADAYHGPAYAQRALARARLGEVRDAWGDAETAALVGDALAGRSAAAVVDGIARDTVAAKARVQPFVVLASAKRNPRLLAAGEVALPALALTSAGNEEAAFDLLERVYPQGATVLTLLQHPTYDGVRWKPRYGLLLNRSRRLAVGDGP